jgi:hypothetical protein
VTHRALATRLACNLKTVSCLEVKSHLGGFDQAIHGGDTSSQLGAIVTRLGWCVNVDDGGCVAGQRLSGRSSEVEGEHEVRPDICFTL